MENDSIKYSFLKSDISAQCQIIYNQLSRLKPLFDDIIVIKSYSKTNPIFDELPSFDSVLGEYLSDKQDWDMWLCGFHYGRCIHLKINEVIEEYGWDYNRFHIIQNLSFMFPGDKLEALRSWENWVDSTVCNFDVMRLTKEYHWDYVDSFTEL
ncbi:uncharacterized protein METZ01_LOCUS159158 [marine metagenome]|uniref:Uncharacterized protein n=1 Tax=marine metagenome TaxID=408172 RepID=A0A382AY46_9ZZZZ